MELVDAGLEGVDAAVAGSDLECDRGLEGAHEVRRRNRHVHAPVKAVQAGQRDALKRSNMVSVEQQEHE